MLFVMLIIIEKKTNYICADSKAFNCKSLRRVQAYMIYKLHSRTKLLLQGLYII